MFKMAERSDGCSDETLLAPCTRKKRLQRKMTKGYYWIGVQENIAMFTKGDKWYKTNEKKEEPELQLLPNKELLSFLQENRDRAAKGDREEWEVPPRIVPHSPVPNVWKTAPRCISLLWSVDKTKAEPQETKKDQEIVGELYKKLVILRRQICDEQDVLPQYIAPNRSLIDIAKMRPNTLHALSTIDGMKQFVVVKVGQRFIDCIVDFCQKENVKMNVALDEVESASSQGQKVETKNKVERGKNGSGVVKWVFADVFFNSTDWQIYPLLKTWREQTAVKVLEPEADIARLRILLEDTITDHLATALKYGYPLDFHRIGVTEEDIKTIVNAIRSSSLNSDISRLRVIKERLPFHITWGKLKMVIALIEITFGMLRPSIPKKRSFSSSINDSWPSSSQNSSHSQNNQLLSRSSSTPPLSQGVKRKVPDWMTTNKSMQNFKNYKRSSSKKSFF